MYRPCDIPFAYIKALNYLYPVKVFNSTLPEISIEHQDELDFILHSIQDNNTFYPFKNEFTEIIVELFQLVEWSKTTMEYCLIYNELRQVLFRYINLGNLTEVELTYLGFIECIGGYCIPSYILPILPQMDVYDFINDRLCKMHTDEVVLDDNFYTRYLYLIEMETS